MIRTRCLVAVLSVALAFLPNGADAQPVTGAVVVQRMHDSYAGKWYHTLTFTQKTTLRRRDGSSTEQTWLESMRYTPAAGTQLRIDFGSLADGRGVLYTADSSWRVQGGKAGPGRAEGNEFIPLIQSVYVQPVGKTIDELTRAGFDLSRGYTGSVDGQAVWMVGASSLSDTTSSRFVVDTVRRVLVQMVLSRAGQPAISVKLGGYVKAGAGWLATKIDMTSNGMPLQTEEYSDWKTDVVLPASLFDLSQWSTAPHWARKIP